MTTMKKMLMVFAAVLCGWMTIGAQGLAGKTKMSSWLLNQYQQQQAAVKKNGGPLRVKGKPVRNYMLTLVQSSDDAATVRQKGGVVGIQFAVLLINTNVHIAENDDEPRKAKE